MLRSKLLEWMCSRCYYRSTTNGGSECVFRGHETNPPIRRAQRYPDEGRYDKHACQVGRLAQCETFSRQFFSQKAVSSNLNLIDDGKVFAVFWCFIFHNTVYKIYTTTMMSMMNKFILLLLLPLSLYAQSQEYNPYENTGYHAPKLADNFSSKSSGGAKFGVALVVMSIVGVAAYVAVAYKKYRRQARELGLAEMRNSPTFATFRDTSDALSGDIRGADREFV